MTSALSNQCADSKKYFDPVCELLERIYSGEMHRLLQDVDRTMPNNNFFAPASASRGIFTREAQGAVQIMFETLQKDYRHEDCRRPLWELFKTCVDTSNGIEILHHLKKENAHQQQQQEEEEKLQQKEDEEFDKNEEEDNKLLAVANMSLDVDKKGLGQTKSFNLKDEELIRQAEEQDQEQGELMKLHLETYAQADSESSALFLASASKSTAAHTKNHTELLTPDSFLDLVVAVGVGKGTSSSKDILRMFLLLATEAWDVLKCVEDELAQKMQAEKIATGFKAFGATVYTLLLVLLYPFSPTLTLFCLSYYACIRAGHYMNLNVD